MKNKLKILGAGVLVALKSVAGLVLCTGAGYCLYDVTQSRGYIAVIAFAAAIFLLITSLSILYEIGERFKNVKK